MNFKAAFAVAALGCFGCAGSAELSDGDVGEELIGSDEDLATTADALTGTIAVGSTLKTTGNLNLRTGPSTGYSVRLVIPNGASVTTVNQAAGSGGFYNIKYNGTTGWSSGAYLKLVTSGTPTPTEPTPTAAGLDDRTPGGAIARAKSAVGGTYWWGHGKWYPNNVGGNNSAGSCTGSCPNCSHTGTSGADCSGYVAKLWNVPSSNTNLSSDSHPYSTVTFNSDTSQWRTVSRNAVVQSDALVYNTNGAGHIFLYSSGDGWGWINAYEAKGCATGIVYNLRTASNAFHAIRHY